MQHYPVVVVGGGVTGLGILRDLSMRGIKVVLLEQKDLVHGASSRFHGLLHSGGRYVVTDPEAAKECIEENYILKRIAHYSIERTEGLFVRIQEDSSTEYEDNWREGCESAGIDVKRISVDEALRLEPNLSPALASAFIVPDSVIDGFRLCWQNVSSAQSYGGEVRTYSKVISINHNGGNVQSVTVQSSINGKVYDIHCDFVVNATGSWVGQVAKLADLPVQVSPDRGLLLIFNHRFTDRVVNRLHKPSDGDIFVPHGSVTILGTTSVPVEHPDDTAVLTEECLSLIETGKHIFPDIDKYRILRGFAGTRPLYTPDRGDKFLEGARGISRNFVVIDHEDAGLTGMASILGGKLTTYRLMAEKMSDLVASKFKNTAKCRTAEEPLVQSLSEDVKARAKKIFPTMGINLTISRQPDIFENIVKTIEDDLAKRVLLCECELVTQAEFEEVALKPTSHNLADIRRRTRLGMGTCQGCFCAYRAGAAMERILASYLNDGGGENEEGNEIIARYGTSAEMIRKFVQERWNGVRPMLWGTQIREMELTRGIYGTLFNVDGDSSGEL